MSKINSTPADGRILQKKTERESAEMVNCGAIRIRINGLKPHEALLVRLIAKRVNSKIDDQSDPMMVAAKADIFDELLIIVARQECYSESMDEPLLQDIINKKLDTLIEQFTTPNRNSRVRNTVCIENRVVYCEEDMGDEEDANKTPTWGRCVGGVADVRDQVVASEDMRLMHEYADRRAGIYPRVLNMLLASAEPIEIAAKLGVTPARIRQVKRELTRALGEIQEKSPKTKNQVENRC